MLKKYFFKISFACAVTAFFAACSTPTVSSDDDEDLYRRSSASKKGKSSSSEEATSSSSETKQSVYDAVVKSGVYTTCRLMERRERNESSTDRFLRQAVFVHEI